MISPQNGMVIQRVSDDSGAWGSAHDRYVPANVDHGSCRETNKGPAICRDGHAHGLPRRWAMADNMRRKSWSRGSQAEVFLRMCELSVGIFVRFVHVLHLHSLACLYTRLGVHASAFYLQNIFKHVHALLWFDWLCSILQAAHVVAHGCVNVHVWAHM